MNVVRVISQHAVDRFRERSGSQQSEDKICKKLFEMADKATPVSLKEHLRVREMLYHDFQSALYLKFSDWILVVVGNELVTIHHNEWKAIKT